MPELLTPDQTSAALASLPQWTLEGGEIVRTFKFPSYMAGIAFVNEVARLAEAANHHPDISIGWRKVTLKFSTHSKGGLTELDTDMAAKCDAESAKPA